MRGLNKAWEYREVQLDFTPQMDVFYMLLERWHTKNTNRSLEQYLIYFNFLSKIQMDHPVIQGGARWQLLMRARHGILLLPTL